MIFMSPLCRERFHAEDRDVFVLKRQLELTLSQFSSDLSLVLVGYLAIRPTWVSNMDGLEALDDVWNWVPKLPAFTTSFRTVRCRRRRRRVFRPSY